MSDVKINESRVHFGPFFSVGLHRTLRIPETEGSFPLPPGLGLFPIFNVSDYAGREPQDWLLRGGGFIPMYQREALWIGFDAPRWRPVAVMVHVGGINAVSGQRYSNELRSDPQNYVVCPDQVWLDGVNAGEGVIRQFVAMPLGQGYSVEAAITGHESVGGIQIKVFQPKAGLFPDKPPRQVQEDKIRPMASPLIGGAKMGLGAGGRMKQKIYPDRHGIDTWDPENCSEIEIQILNSDYFEQVTGQKPPPTPINAEKYTEYGLPWFDLYDEGKEDVGAPEILKNIKTISQTDKERGERGPTNAPLKIDDDQILKLPPNESPKRGS